MFPTDSNSQIHGSLLYNCYYCILGWIIYQGICFWRKLILLTKAPPTFGALHLGMGPLQNFPHSHWYVDWFDVVIIQILFRQRHY